MKMNSLYLKKKKDLTLPTSFVRRMKERTIIIKKIKGKIMES